MLSPAQQVAAQTLGHVLIAACPGSGKTTVLKHRAQHLLSTSPEDRLAAVTFTREAADSLRARIAAQYPAGAKRVEAGTFHSLCIAQLKANGKFRELADPRSEISLINRAINKWPRQEPTLKYEDYKTAIDRWQRELSPVLPPKETSALAFVFYEYNRLKEQHGLQDFSDVIRNAVLGMRDGSVRPLAVKFMLVDEFQDTDQMQLLWVLEHAKAGVDVTIVGDDDQSIYGFRGSLGYDGMLEFQRQTDATVINLDRTYRCPREVLLPAAMLISHNTARVSKRLITACATPGVVRKLSFEDRESEAMAVIEAIEASGDPEKWGILARTNSQLNDIDARVSGRFKIKRKKEEKFWGLKGPKDLLSLCNSIANRDMVGVSEAMTLCDVHTDHLDKLAREFDFSSQGALDRFIGARFNNKAGFIGVVQKEVSEWRTMVASNSQKQLKLALGGMAQFLAEYGKWNSRDINDTVDRLQSATRTIASMNGTLQERMRTLSRTNNDKGEGASLLSLHASKGLEFENVWIIGCDDGSLPILRDDSDIQEERRLFYVGITRSMRTLTMSHTIGKSSPFLSEAGYGAKGMFAPEGEKLAYA